MLQTPLCDLLGIDYPIMQAAIWPATSPQLIAAVSNAGALGSLAAVFASPDELTSHVERVRELTDRPFAVNHVVPILDEATFARTLELKPAVISLAVGEPGDLVARAHAAGIKVIHQIHTVAQSRQAAAAGVDAIIAQGSEAGGQGLAGGPSTFVLVPQVVDAVAPIPVLAAGGIADGRGLAAALALGAQGVNVGTRFLTSDEASTPDDWTAAVIAAESEQVVRFERWRHIMPPSSPTAYDAVPNVIRTNFVDQWRSRPDEAQQEADHLRGQIMTAVRERHIHDILPFTGQSAGLVHEVLPAAQIVQSMVAGAERVLAEAGAVPLQVE
jgi:nitronate monooxygenase/enoyl-[acyl-carrier protein] reductase II